MNVAQHRASYARRKRALEIGHDASWFRDVLGGPVHARCSCGWSVKVYHRNALARTAKVEKAINDHERGVLAQRCGVEVSS